MNILIIDDDIGIIESLKDSLAKYNIDGSTTSVEGIEKLKVNKFDLLILDYYIDGLNGSNVIDEVRKFNKDLPIWLLTGHKDDLEPMQTLSTLDIQGYIDKTGHFENVLISIESAIKSAQKYTQISSSQSITIAQRMRELRRIHNVSQEDLAKLLNVRRNTISNYESGICEPSIESMKTLAQYFGITVDYLINYTLDYSKSKFTM